MSERNVGVLRALFEAYNARDVDSLIEYFDPSIEYHSAFAAVSGGVYRGHDGIRKWHRDIEDAWGEEIRLQPEAYFDLGEQTLAFYVLRGRGKHSGVEVAMPNALVATWREDLVVYLKSYAHREDALRELGVSADELERIEP